MATHIFANLLGDWVDLNSDPDCVMGSQMVPPTIWWKENAEIYAPVVRPASNSFYHENYLNVKYKGKNYRIQPCHIQIVTQ